jgi:hypothetical protein
MGTLPMVPKKSGLLTDHPSLAGHLEYEVVMPTEAKKQPESTKRRGGYPKGVPARCGVPDHRADTGQTGCAKNASTTASARGDERRRRSPRRTPGCAWEVKRTTVRRSDGSTLARPSTSPGGSLRSGLCLLRLGHQHSTQHRSLKPVTKSIDRYEEELGEPKHRWTTRCHR